MTMSRTSHFGTILGSIALIVLAGFGVFVLSEVGSGRAAAQDAAPDPSGTIGMMPSETWFIACADVKRVMADAGLGELAQSILSLAEAEERELQEVRSDFVRETGVDPLKDIEQLVFCAGAFRRYDPSLAFMGRADWNPEGVIGFFSKKMSGQSLTREEVNGKTLLSWSRPEREPETALAFLDPRLMVVGSYSSVHDMLTQRNAKDGNSLDGRMRKALNGVDRTTPIWAIGAIPAPALEEVYEEASRRRDTERLEQVFFRCLLTPASFSASLKVQPEGVVITLTCHTLIEEDNARYALVIEGFRQRLLKEAQAERGEIADRTGRYRDLHMEMKALDIAIAALNGARIAPGRGRVDITLSRSSAEVKEISALVAQAARWRTEARRKPKPGGRLEAVRQRREAERRRLAEARAKAAEARRRAMEARKKAEAEARALAEKRRREKEEANRPAADETKVPGTRE